MRSSLKLVLCFVVLVSVDAVRYPDPECGEVLRKADRCVRSILPFARRHEKRPNNLADIDEWCRERDEAADCVTEAADCLADEGSRVAIRAFAANGRLVTADTCPTSATKERLLSELNCIHGKDNSLHNIFNKHVARMEYVSTRVSDAELPIGLCCINLLYRQQLLDGMTAQCNAKVANDLMCSFDKGVKPTIDMLCPKELKTVDQCKEQYPNMYSALVEVENQGTERSDSVLSHFSKIINRMSTNSGQVPTGNLLTKLYDSVISMFNRFAFWK